MHWSWLPELVLGSPGRTIYMLVRRSEGKEEWVKQKAHSTVYGGVLGVQLTIVSPAFICFARNDIKFDQ